MREVYGLFAAGLKWSYRKYGTRGAVAFLLAGAVAYYLLDRKLEELVERDAPSSGANDPTSTGETGVSSA